MVFFEGGDKHTLIGKEVCVLQSLIFGEEEESCNALENIHQIHRFK